LCDCPPDRQPTWRWAEKLHQSADDFLQNMFQDSTFHYLPLGTSKRMGNSKIVILGVYLTIAHQSDC